MTGSDNVRTIWRYMDLGKYVSLLSEGLFFCRPDALGDNWEGSWGLKDVLLFRQAQTQLSVAQITERWSQKYNAKHQSIQAIGVSSWHKSNQESAALWQLYMPRGLGVAVKSTIERVLKATRAIDLNQSLITRDVEYVNYDSAGLGDDPIILLSRKRQEFAHEKELRFLLTFSDEEQQAIAFWDELENERRTRHVPIGETGPLILSYSRMSTSSDVLLRSASVGVSLPIDASTLIEKVYLAPGSSSYLRRAVRTVTELHGVSAKVISEADIDNVPVDSIEFHEPTPKLQLPPISP